MIPQTLFTADELFFDAITVMKAWLSQEQRSAYVELLARVLNESINFILIKGIPRKVQRTLSETVPTFIRTSPEEGRALVSRLALFNINEAAAIGLVDMAMDEAMAEIRGEFKGRTPVRISVNVDLSSGENPELPRAKSSKSRHHHHHHHPRADRRSSSPPGREERVRLDLLDRLDALDRQMKYYHQGYMCSWDM